MLLFVVAVALSGGSARADVFYVYDDAGRLIGAIDSAGDSATYRYDAVGNLLGIARGGAGGPAITSFTPTSGGPGTAVTVSGAGYAGAPSDNVLTFGGVRATVTSSTPTRLTVTVPTGAATGPLTVTTPAGSARSSGVFAVTAADLAPTALRAPATAGAQQPITVSWTVTNRGTGAAKVGWRDLVYLSADPLCCAGESPVADATLPAGLGPGQSYTRSQAITLPRVPAGQYYLVVSTDVDRALAEGDESNNRRALPIAISTPDLVPTAFAVPLTWAPGQSLTATYSVKNQGMGAAYARWKDALLLSASPECCAGATQLGSAARTTVLGPGASYSQSIPFTVPSLLPRGPYFVFLSVDHGDGATESDEANNRRALPITVTAADVTPTAVTGPASATTQQSIAVSWTVKNQGDAAATAPWIDRVYLYSTPVCCWYSPVLVSASRPAPLGPGASYTQSRSVTVPNVPAGTYYLAVRADDGQVVVESDDGNNERSTPIVVTTPDLTGASLAAPASARALQTVALAWTVSNVGSGPAKAAWTDSVYLSTDPACCAGDTVLASASRTTALAAGASYAVSKTVTIPSRPPGSYYLILKADSGNTVYEADEANNLRVVPFTIAP